MPCKQTSFRIAPADTFARRVLKDGPPTPEHFLDLSLTYYHAGNYEESVDAARAALRLRPNYAEAWNNIAAARQFQERWDDAIQAAEAALRIKPDFPLAKNNLAFSRQQKGATKKSAAHGIIPE